MCCQFGLLLAQQLPKTAHLNMAAIKVGSVGVGIQHLRKFMHTSVNEMTATCVLFSSCNRYCLFNNITYIQSASGMSCMWYNQPLNLNYLLKQHDGEPECSETIIINSQQKQSNKKVHTLHPNKQEAAAAGISA